MLVRENLYFYDIFLCSETSEISLLSQIHWAENSKKLDSLSLCENCGGRSKSSLSFLTTSETGVFKSVLPFLRKYFKRLIYEK